MPKASLLDCEATPTRLHQPAAQAWRTQTNDQESGQESLWKKTLNLVQNKAFWVHPYNQIPGTGELSQGLKRPIQTFVAVKPAYKNQTQGSPEEP